MHVIITGGSSGIGAAVAELEAARDGRISLIARREDLLAQQRARLLQLFPNASIHISAADVTNAAALTEAIRNCEAKFGPCDRLVSAAGIVEPGELISQPIENFRAQIECNLFGTVHAVRAVYPGMVERQSGQLVIISSGAGLIGIHGYSAYCASKHALAGFAEALRQEARPNGIAVSICFPPDTETEQLAAELPLRSPAASAIIGNTKPWPAAQVASIIVKGADRGRFEIYPGVQMALLGRFGALVAPVLRRYFDWRASTAHKKQAH